MQGQEQNSAIRKHLSYVLTCGYIYWICDSVCTCINVTNNFEYLLLIMPNNEMRPYFGGVGIFWKPFSQNKVLGILIERVNIPIYSESKFVWSFILPENDQKYNLAQDREVLYSTSISCCSVGSVWGYNDTELRATEAYNLRSSASILKVQESFEHTKLIYIKNNSGPNTEPCGTPLHTSLLLLKLTPTHTRYDSIC